MTNILIVGLGLIGGSYARGLSESGYQVRAIDINEDSIQFAKEQGWIEEGLTDVNYEWLSNSNIIILGLYPKDVIEFVRLHHSHFKKGSIITDVTGVKKGVVESVQEMLSDVEFIASHPMAGKEVSGVRYSDHAIFKSANFIITPTEKNTQKGIDVITQLATDLKFNHISVLSIEEHDKMIAFLSQLTHVIAVTLMNTNDNTHLVDYTGDSFRDLTRIAKINENLWSELFLMNKDFLLHEIEDFQSELESFRKILQNEDIDEMKKKFIQSTKRRKQFE